MLLNILTKIFGNKNQRELKRLNLKVEQVNHFEKTLTNLSDQELRDKTFALRDQVQSKGKSLDQVLPEAFACVREAGKRTLELRHYDVQLIGGMVLHQGKIAEMQTGEGKTLVATLPAYLNSLSGKKVHIVTVNDYLAQRDAEWMKPLYNLLGVSVGFVCSSQPSTDKRAAYQADIVYGTNNEFGFDYLRDNMALSIEDKLQGELSYAIIDEVDSILIDEARTPLVISGPAEDSSELYRQINPIIPSLVRETQVLTNKTSILDTDQPEPLGDYIVDEKDRQVEITEVGHDKLEKLLREKSLLPEDQDLYALSNLKILHHIQAALKAHVLFQKNVHYIVKDQQIVIIDEHTGRSMAGRRWSEGIHQAIEAKENLPIQNENQTLASTTFQNYFRLYTKLAGMTGTADTEAFEFRQIYGLDVVVIPSNKPNQRIDYNDLIYMNLQEKYEAIIAEIKTCHSKNQPVLVGTASIEASEQLSAMLDKLGIKHNVLNAKQHEREAGVIAQAGKPGMITIATNMAGRGTDIILGGNLEAELDKLEDKTETAINKRTEQWRQAHQQVLEAGGLHVIGGERHESRRIDNQLRGRSGRQGDPGSTRFFLSLEDNLLRIFASNAMRGLMQKIAVSNQPIEHSMVNNAIAKAQKRVERHNFDIRKQLLEYDDIASEQRQLIYHERHQLIHELGLLESPDNTENIPKDMVLSIYPKVLTQIINQYIAPDTMAETWDIPGLEEALKKQFNIVLPVQQWLDQDDKMDEDALKIKLSEAMDQHYQTRKEAVPEMVFVKAQKYMMLQILDAKWKEHLANMDQLRQGIQWRGYAQKSPKQEYKREAFELFQTLLYEIQLETVRLIFHVQFSAQLPGMEQNKADTERMTLEHKAPDSPLAERDNSFEDGVLAKEKSEAGEGNKADQPYVREFPKVGRNQPCPCNSGKKYKHCHGALV